MPNNRAKMVKGSVWVFPKDTVIERQYKNPEFEQLEYREFDKIVKPDRSIYDDPKRLAAAKRQAKKAASEVHPEVLKFDALSYPAGTELKFLDKADTYVTANVGPNHEYVQLDGIYFSVQINGERVRLPFRELDAAIEPVGLIEVTEWAIRDTTTGLFYANYSSEDISQPGDDPWSRTWEHKPQFAETFMKAKRFKDLGKAKQWVIGACGYFVDLPGSENRPYWSGGEDKLFDIPESWEFVKFDKIAKTEIETVDLQDWHRRLWKLRGLTVQFGSPVRKLYNELEKKGTLNEYLGMLVYKGDDVDAAKISELLKEFGFKKGDVKTARDENVLAIACKSLDILVNAKLALAHKFQFDVVDIQQLEAVVV